MSIVPSPWPVAHIHRYFGTTEDEHGNFSRIEDPPVVRYVMSLTQARALEVVGTDYSLRTDTHLDMACADPTVYYPDDHVMIWPELDENGDYVPESGTLYWVDGDPSDERVGPWPSLLAMFGGVVKLRKVT